MSETLDQTDVARRLAEGETLRRDFGSHAISLTVRRSGRRGWVVDGYFRETPLDCVATSYAFILQASIWTGTELGGRWTKEQAVEAAMRSYTSGAPF